MPARPHEILDLVCELRKSLHKTIVLVTHDPRAAERAARVLYLDKGKLVAHLDLYAERPHAMKFLLLIVKNVRRNLLRTILTSLGTMVLVFVVTLIWSVLGFLDRETEEQSQNVKGIVTERWQIPSRMPFSYAPRCRTIRLAEPGRRAAVGRR